MSPITGKRGERQNPRGESDVPNLADVMPEQLDEMGLGVPDLLQ